MSNRNEVNYKLTLWSSVMLRTKQFWTSRHPPQSVPSAYHQGLTLTFDITMNTGFIGIGSMGGMLVRALLRSRALAVENVWAANRSEGKLAALAAEFPGIHVASDRKLAANCDLIFLCLKAPDAASVLAQMGPELHPGQLLVTTASQIPLQALENRVPCRMAKLNPLHHTGDWCRRRFADVWLSRHCG